MEGGGNWLPVCPPDPWVHTWGDEGIRQSFRREEQP